MLASLLGVALTAVQPFQLGRVNGIRVRFTDDLAGGVVRLVPLDLDGGERLPIALTSGDSGWIQFPRTVAIRLEVVGTSRTADVWWGDEEGDGLDAQALVQDGGPGAQFDTRILATPIATPQTFTFKRPSWATRGRLLYGHDMTGPPSITYSFQDDLGNVLYAAGPVGLGGAQPLHLLMATGEPLPSVGTGTSQVPGADYEWNVPLSMVVAIALGNGGTGGTFLRWVCGWSK